MANKQKIAVGTFAYPLTRDVGADPSGDYELFDDAIKQYVQMLFDANPHVQIQYVSLPSALMIVAKMPDHETIEEDRAARAPKHEPKALKNLIGLLSDRDFKDNFKGVKLVEYLESKFIVISKPNDEHQKETSERA